MSERDTLKSERNKKVSASIILGHINLWIMGKLIRVGTSAR